MKPINFVSLFLYSFFLFTFLSCNKNNDFTPKNNSVEQVSDLVTLHGNLDGNIVVVSTQGGPLTFLDDKVLDEFITEAQAQSALFVNVHQEQTKNPSKFKSADITFEQAKQYDLQSVAYLKRVVDFYKSQQGKTVYVLGISFGAFIAQELIFQYGIDVADGYLIMVGRLDMDKDTWQSFSQGKYAGYDYDNNGNYTINFFGDAPDTEHKNTAKLAAGLGYNRYTDKLKNISDLSKITYVHGNRDSQVGPLSTQEIQFLNGKGAKTVLADGAGHNEAISKGLAILKQTFGI